jgi:hypothetical protein
MRVLGSLVLLMALYLAGTTALALAVDRRFFVNDALALAIWIIFGLLLAGSGVIHAGRR